MPRGYRFLIVAAGLGALIWAADFGFVLGSLKYPYEERYPSYRYAADDEKAAIAPIGKHVQALEEREPCHDPKGHDESDLCAQWRAAKAAEDSAFWAKGSFWITFFGAIGLAVTLWFNLKAWEAARKANEISEDTAKRELRAYLSAAPGGLTIGPHQKIVGSIAVKNVGQTPASDVIHQAFIGIFDKRPETDLTKMVVTVRDCDTSINPNQELFFYSDDYEYYLTEDTITELLSGSLCIVIFGAVSYRDIFNRVQTTRFSYWYGNGKYDAASGRFCPKGNSAT